MKKIYLILIVFLISLGSVKGQNPNYSCVINFELNPCWEGAYGEIIIPEKSIWRIFEPFNTIFDSAWSYSDAILTHDDTVGYYPVNNTSSFIIKFIPIQYCMCLPMIGGWYKFDSDSLKDYGKIEFSRDHGMTWLDVLSDAVIPDEAWTTPKPILTGRIHQWREFNAILPSDFKLDTLYYRFTFISDNIQTQQEGWMLDDIRVIIHTEGIEDIRSRDEINIYPNPATNIISVSATNLIGDLDISIYDIVGQLALRQKVKSNDNIDISGLCKGIYVARVFDGNRLWSGKIVKE